MQSDLKSDHHNFRSMLKFFGLFLGHLLKNLCHHDIWSRTNFSNDKFILELPLSIFHQIAPGIYSDLIMHFRLKFSISISEIILY